MKPVPVALSPVLISSGDKEFLSWFVVVQEVINNKMNRFRRNKLSFMLFDIPPPNNRMMGYSKVWALIVQVGLYKRGRKCTLDLLRLECFQ